MKCKSFNAFFETISNKTRMKIVEALMAKDMSVSEICRKLNEEQSKVSHNLKILKDCRFVDCKTKGKERIYSLNKKTIVPMLKLIDKHASTYCDCKKCIEVCRRRR
ncbi:metalloregulator ArsR/SmtB family transcription factor [Candidatus Woesearchaeota archaeon]|nr:metalloregulator ArsR/SmtB family transcription factor [Candidatus Woesearchaeota archaeon]